MSAALKPYPEYRDSGVDWLGQVPSHWIVDRAKAQFREVDERSKAGDEELLSVSHKTGVTPRRFKTITMFQAESYAGYKLARSADLVVNTMWAWMAALGVSQHDGIVSNAYGVYRPREGAEMDGRYYDRLLRTEMYRAEYVRRSTGITTSRLRLYPPKLLAMPLIQPPPEEQRRIADFLDAYTAQVHRLIAAKRRTIALWNEARLAKIAFVLGAGSAADAELTGGPEWWSSVPDGWSVARLRSLLRTKSGDMIDGVDEVAEGIPIYGGNGIRGYAPKANTTGPILLLGRVGAKCGCVHFVDGPLWASEHALRVYPKIDFDLQYLRLILELTDLNRYAISTAQPLITGRIVGEQSTLLAPRNLQQGLAAQAIAQAAEVDDAIAKLLAEIDLILEYRDSLIAAVVTGRLDVRDAAIPVVKGDDLATDTATDDEDMEDALDAVD